MNIVVIQGINNMVGTTSVCASLAYSMSRMDLKVMCVDAALNQEGSQLASLFGLEAPEYGFTDAISENTSFFNHENKAPLTYCYDETCLFMAKGSAKFSNYEQSADIFIKMLKEVPGLDYVIIDAGSRDGHFAKEIAKLSDMTVTVTQAEGNSLTRLNRLCVSDNEYFLINKVVRNSKVMRDIVTMLRDSRLKSSLLRADLSYDENMINAGLYEMPLCRYLPVSSCALDIEKIIFEIILICNEVKGADKL